MFRNTSWIFVILTLVLDCIAETLFDEEAARCYIERKRTRRILECPPMVNDPRFNDQWMLVPRPYDEFGGLTTVDLGIIDVWVDYQFMGENITVVVNDDGFHPNHSELYHAYSESISWDYAYRRRDPSGGYHGTMVAGVVGMAINNNFCGVGVAPLVTLGGRRVLAYNMNPNVLKALVDNIQHVDITVNSYAVNGVVYHQIPWALLRALQESITKGRYGRGTISVYAAGNSKSENISCSFDMYVQNIYTIAVAAINPWGSTSPYSSRCAAVIVSAPSSPNFPFLITSSSGGGCTTQFGGTSASTPLVAGIVALTLNANYYLTWRAVHALLVITSSHENVQFRSQASFDINGAGLRVSLDFGFGLINAHRMVESAFYFKELPEMHKCSATVHLASNYFNNTRYFASTLVDGCLDEPGNEVLYIEHLQLRIRATYPAWHSLQIDILSPMGTRTHMLEKESYFRSSLSTIEWIFDSVVTWGESPLGEWHIFFYDSRTYSSRAVVYELELIFYGTQDKPHYLDVSY